MTDTPMRIEARFDASLLDDLRRDNEQLREAAHYAKVILASIPAFGDSIGSQVTKAQIGVAYNKLNKALTKGGAQ